MIFFVFSIGCPKQSQKRETIRPWKSNWFEKGRYTGGFSGYLKFCQDKCNLHNRLNRQIFHRENTRTYVKQLFFKDITILHFSFAQYMKRYTFCWGTWATAVDATTIVSLTHIRYIFTKKSD